MANRIPDETDRDILKLLSKDGRISWSAVGSQLGLSRTVRNLGQKSLHEIRGRVLQYGYEQLSEEEKRSFFLRCIELNGKKSSALPAAAASSGRMAMQGLNAIPSSTLKCGH